MITYSDEAAIDEGSFDSGDIAVTPGPLSVSGVSNLGATVTYTLTPPGGSWDAGDNGSYSIAQHANQVFDLALTGANAAPAATLGSFSVAIAEIDVSGNAVSIVNGDATPGLTDDTDFGDVTVAATAMRTYTISNTGLGTINITDPVLVFGAGFSVSQPASLVLAAGASTTITVSFNPTVTGPVTGTVIIPNDDADEDPYVFNLSANGVALGSAEIDVTGNGISIVSGDSTPDLADDTDFGNVAIGATAIRTFTITNTGLSTLNITGSVSIIGVGFSVSQPASTLLAAGASTTIKASFNPAAQGLVIGTVIIPNDDDDEDPYLFNLSGNGVILSDGIFSNGFE